jgi:hypothetical protein
VIRFAQKSSTSSLCKLLKLTDRARRWPAPGWGLTPLFSLLSSTSSPRDYAVFYWSNWPWITLFTHHIFENSLWALELLVSGISPRVERNKWWWHRWCWCWRPLGNRYWMFNVVTSSPHEEGEEKRRLGCFVSAAAIIRRRWLIPVECACVRARRQLTGADCWHAGHSWGSSRSLDERVQLLVMVSGGVDCWQGTGGCWRRPSPQLLITSYTVSSLVLLVVLMM